MLFDVGAAGVSKSKDDDYALHDSLDYSMTHTVVGESPGKKVHDRMLTALGSVCFYGTAYYAEEIVGDKSNRCPIEDNPDHKSTSKTVTTEEEKSETVVDPMPGAKRFNMGGSIGLFDDGFIVRHVQSQDVGSSCRSNMPHVIQKISDFCQAEEATVEV